MTRRAERGSILVQVALLSAALIGCLGLVIDQGVVWVARAQAQNAADAGALAAATTFAFDTVNFSKAPSLAGRASKAVAGSTSVWGAAPDVATSSCFGGDGVCAEIASFPEPQGRILFGATVEVSRALPTYFSQIFGVTSHTVRAYATGAVVPANTATCVWPLAIPDQWAENSDPGDSVFSAIAYPAGPPTAVAIPDSYIAPGDSDYSTGYRLLNTTLSPTVDEVAVTNLAVGPMAPSLAEPWPAADVNRFVPVVIPRNSGGGFSASLTSCNQRPIHVGDVLTPDAGPDATMAEVEHAVADLFSRDGTAVWDTSRLRVSGSCAGRTPACAQISPRLVTIPIYDPKLYDATRGGTPEIRIVNFVGLFLGEPDGSPGVRGHLSVIPGIIDARFPMVDYQWALMRTAVLTR